MKVKKELWWNDMDPLQDLSQWLFVQIKYHTKCPCLKPGQPKWESGT